MEPALHTGDLVIAYRQSEYSLGDTVIYERYGGYVIHRLIDVNDDGTFKSKGINNDDVDIWSVPVENIYGQKVLMVPGFGKVIQDFTNNPLAVGFGSVLLALLVIGPMRKPKVLGEARTLIESNLTEQVRFRGKRTYLFWVFSLMAMNVLSLTMFFLFKNVEFWPKVGVCLIVFVVIALLFGAYGLYLFDGVGLNEPQKSLVILGPHFHRISEDQKILGKVTEVSSAKELRRIKDKLNTIVLHKVLPGGKHEFYVAAPGENFRFCS